MKVEIEEKADAEDSSHEVDKITADVVKAAFKRLKPGKGDVTGS